MSFPHSEETRAEFRAHYLFSGNASESARHVKVPERTGNEWAKALSADESFVADRRALQTRALSELVAMRMRVARKSLERHEEPSFEGEIDKRPDYGKLVIEAEKAAHNLAKIENESARPDESGDFVVNVYGPGQEPEKPDGG